MSILLPLLISTLAGLSTMVGSLFTFFKIRSINSFVCFCLSFSLSIMICISIFELMPESCMYIIGVYNDRVGVLLICAFFIVGVYITKIIDLMFADRTNNLSKLGFLSAIALLIHNIPEGIATFMSSYNDMNSGISLSVAIMLHNIPEGISIAIPLFYSGRKRGECIFITLLAGLAEPVGAIMAYVILNKYINSLSLSLILIVVAGIMICLSIEEIYPKVLSYNMRKPTYAGLICGVVISIINIVLF